MRTQEQINAELETLTQELAAVEGTRTEVYTRIVGYYRSVVNWNKGKREEYQFRKMYVPGPLPRKDNVRTSDAEPVREAARVPAVENLEYYIFFYRNTCPNCPPVKSYITRLPIQGRQVNVDETEGFALAEELKVLAAPTVVFFDADNNEIYRAHNVQSLKEIARFAGIKRELAPV